jgi:hypothetical protein
VFFFRPLELGERAATDKGGSVVEPAASLGSSPSTSSSRSRRRGRGQHRVREREEDDVRDPAVSFSVRERERGSLSAFLG